MLQVKTLRVRARAGVLCSVPGARMQVRYVGRAYDPKGDPNDLEAEFPIVKDAVEVPNTHLMRKAVADGDLLAADDETAKACGVKIEAVEKAAEDAAEPRARKGSSPSHGT